MKSSAEVRFSVCMLSSTAEKWIKDNCNGHILPHDIGGEYWQMDDDDEQKCHFVWPSDRMSGETFFSLVSAFLSSNDRVYPGTSFECNISSDTAEANFCVTGKGNLVGNMTVIQSVVAEELARRIDEARKALGYD